MALDPLYKKIHNEFQKGEPPLTTRAASARWGYSGGHTRRAMNWMSEKDNPPVLKRISSSPYQWERI